jgi:endonuclease/exonuclease/phosphatase family metal-dependent hydrolase
VRGVVERPGVGFAVAQVPPENGGSTGACPEALVIDGFAPTPSGPEPIAAPRPRDLDRTRYQTLVFGVDGRPLTFATWNVKRFTDFMSFWEWLFAPDAFPDAKVDPALVGAQLAKFDVVALQEAWDKSETAAIVAAANAERAALGLADFQVYGPIDYSKTIGISFDATTGGVYILSPHPVADLGWKIFDDCRGEDCLKAKGVLHARLLINRTTADDDNDGPPRSTDEFVDVYATHLQADEQLCGMLDKAADYIADVVAGIDTGPIGAYIARRLLALVTDGSFHCYDYKSNAAVRARQLAQMDAYIAATADPTRPSIVMGDFNIDGRRLGASSDEYGPMLDALELGPVTMDPTAAAPDDHLTPWPAAFAWDIDQADLGREQVADATWLATGLGTFVGTDGLDDPAGTPPRYDYIFVRPPGRPGSAAFDRQAWVVGHGSGDVWASPLLTDPAAPTIGNRLSDHKPVISSLLLVQLRMPDRFHATWPHHLEFHVAEANAAGHSDCIFGLCGGLDLYGERKDITLTMSGVLSMPVTTTPECSEDGSVLTEHDNPCIQTWGMEVDHIPGTHRRQGAGIDLWEADSTSGDDHYRTVWEDDAALFEIDWPAARVLLRSYNTPGAPACIDGHLEWSPLFPFIVTEHCDGTFDHRAVVDNSDQGICSRNTGGEVVPFMCYRLHWEETPPPP